ncbi:MAG: phosphopentomutase, partial [Myxococcota bacterium]
AYRDRGANTLGNVAVYMGGLDLTILHWLGLGNVAPIRGVAAAPTPAASHAKVHRSSEGTDASGALVEIAGAAAAALIGAGVGCHFIGGAGLLLADVEGLGDAVLHSCPDPADVLRHVTDIVQRDNVGLVVACPEIDADADAKIGPAGLARTLARFDAALGTLLDGLTSDTLLILTSLGGNDATITTRSGATREFAPMLAYTPSIPSGVDLGVRTSLADIGATIGDVFGIQLEGSSFFSELVA